MTHGLVKEWTQLIGSPETDIAYSVSTALDGSIYITGITEGNLDGQTNSGGSDAFITKFNSNGSKEWTQLIGSPFYDHASSVSTTTDGSIYITGYTYGNLDEQIRNGIVDSFVAKYSSDGSRAWTRFLGGSVSIAYAWSISTTPNGSIYIAGETINGPDDALVAKFNSDGSKVWGVITGSASWDSAKSVSTDADEAIYVAGVTNGEGIGGLYGKHNGGSDAFIAKFLSDTNFNGSGTFEWVQLIGSYDTDIAYSVSAALDGSVYIVGATHGNLDGQTNSGKNDAFITKFSGSGSKEWTQLIGSPDIDIAYSVSTALDGSIYVAGITHGNLDGQINSGGNDAFITKFNGNGSKEWTQLIGTSSYDEVHSISTTANGSIYIAGLTWGDLDGEINSGRSDAFVTKYTSISTLNNPILRGNSLYTVVPGPSWTQAEANAVKLGGHLTAIGSEEENQFVWTEFGPSDTAANQKWIGLNDAEEEGTWRWSNGEEVLYTNWAYIAPANTSGISYEPGTGSDAQDYVNFWWGTNDGTWDDYFENGGWGPDNSKGIAEIPFIRHGDSAYVIVQGPTWEEAEANAVALGGHLVTINDAEENDWIASTFIEPYNSNFFIGATDKVQEGVWRWTNGDSFSYANWYPGEPSNSDGGENYTVISGSPSNPERKGFWNDTKGTTPEFGLVEIELAPNNTPTGTPTISGELKVGSILTIDASDIQDLDNHEYWTPEYQYYWEVADESSDVSLDTSWSSLETEDAVDKNSTLKVTEAMEGKYTRGVVKYLDGYGTDETVYTDAYRIQVTYEQATSNAETVEIWTNETGLGAGINEPFKEPVATNNSWFGNSRFARWFWRRRFNPAPQEPAEQPEPILPYDETAKGVVFTGADNGQTIKASGTFSTSERKSLEVPLIVDAGLGADEITGGNAQNWIQGGGVSSDQEVDELIGVSNTVDVFDLRSDDYSTDAYETGSARITNYGQEDYIVLSGSSEDYSIERLGGVVQQEPEPPQARGWFSWFGRFRNRWSTPPAPKPPEPVSFDIKNAATNDLLANVRGDFMTTSTTVDDLNIQYGVTSSPRETMIGGEQLFA